MLAACSMAHAQREVAVTDELRITGSVRHALTFSTWALSQFPQVPLGDISIKNHKGEEKYVAHNVKGVLLRTLVDSAGIDVAKPKELSEFVLVLTASDGYRNVYSWNEIFNTAVGDRLYILTEKDGKTIMDMDERIQVLSLADTNMGMRRLRGVATIDVRKIGK